MERRDAHRDVALRTSDLLAELAKDLPIDEAARRIYREAAGKLRLLYGLTRDQKQAVVLKHITNGLWSIADLVMVTWYERKELESLLKDLVDRGEVIEIPNNRTGQRGRPCRLWRPKD